MLIETGSSEIPADAAGRPLPPDVKFNAASGIFSGHAAPLATIHLISSTDQHVLTAIADACGAWQIALGKPPRWYTTFEIWASVDEGEASSDKVRFTFGGDNPQLFDVYADRAGAFGRCKSGVKVSVYGPDGRVLGVGLALGRFGTWSVRFQEPLEAEEQVCILAEAFNGHTSMPVFTGAKMLSVTDRNIGHIAGSGAEPGDRVELIDDASGQTLGMDIASGEGNWEVFFEDLLDVGKSIRIVRTHTNGETVDGPIFTAIADDCLAPVINTVSDSQVGGMAQPGLEVEFRQYRNGEVLRDSSVYVETSGLWTSNDTPVEQPFDFQTGDMLTARTRSTDGTKKSVVVANVTIGGSRPGSPLVMHVDQNSAWGYAERSKTIIISAEDTGVIWVTRSGWDGYWSADWTPVVGTLATTTLVVFEAMDSWQLTGDAQTSTATVRYADAMADIPATPVIDTYTGKEFSGSDTSVGTYVICYDRDYLDTAIDPAGALVGNDDRWDVIATSYVPPDGHYVYAEAWVKKDGVLTINSKKSVAVPVDSYVPPTPNVDFAHPSDIEGDEPVLTADLNELPNIVIHIGYASVTPRQSIANSGHLANGKNWKITPSPALNVGDRMIAWAKTDAGAESGEAPFTIAAETVSVPVPPSITYWLSPTVSGTGTYGTVVSVYLNDTFVGSTPVGPSPAYSWKVDIGTTLVKGDKLKAIATDGNGNNSDPFFIINGYVATSLTVETVTTSSVTANVTTGGQRLLAWRDSDGLKVIDKMIGGPGTFTVPYLPGVDVATGDLIKSSSQNTSFSTTEGTMTHYDSKYVPYPD